MSYKTITGKGGISATIVADSVSAVTGTRITTMELVYHRFIHGEVMSHRSLSRNAMSSRAVPVERMIELVETTPAVPIHYGAKQTGMQAKFEVANYADFGQGEYQWHGAMGEAIKRAKTLDKQGYAKQLVNRLLEPYQMVKVLVTATEWDNFFHLRLHSDAQPEIQELARVMKAAMQGSEPEVLQAGMWHVPYVDWTICEIEGVNVQVYSCEDGGELVCTSLEKALKVSASCAAQVSYRRNDQSLEKAIAIYEKLVDSEPVHASAFEHAAMVSGWNYFCLDCQGLEFPEGITHVDRNGDWWSGNFKHFVQYRQLIPNNVYQPVK